MAAASPTGDASYDSVDEFWLGPEISFSNSTSVVEEEVVVDGTTVVAQASATATA